MLVPGKLYRFCNKHPHSPLIDVGWGNLNPGDVVFFVGMESVPGFANALYAFLDQTGHRIWCYYVDDETAAINGWYKRIDSVNSRQTVQV
jgi:hypothetical protein